MWMYTRPCGVNFVNFCVNFVNLVTYWSFGRERTRRKRGEGTKKREIQAGIELKRKEEGEEPKGKKEEKEDNIKSEPS